MRAILLSVSISAWALFALPSIAGEGWVSLARGVDPTDPAAVHAARLSAEAAGEDFWFVEQRGGPLLAACARDLSDAEVAALLDRAGRDEEALGGLVANLAARGDLPSRLLRRDLVGFLAEHLLPTITPIAEDALIHGDPSFAIALLGRPAATVSFASSLADLPYAAGPRLLADVLRGEVVSDAATRARLGEVVPDLYNRYVVRRLGRERIEGLVRVATTDGDGALRALAARLLAASSDPDADGVLVEAYTGARGWRIEPEEWQVLGRDHDVVPGLERIATRDLIDVLEGLVARGFVRASGDPDGAAWMAAGIRGVWSAQEDPFTRGQLLRLLDVYGDAFVAQDRERPWAPEAWRALLGEWAAEGGLAARVAARRRADLLQPRGPRESDPPHTSKEVVARLGSSVIQHLHDEGRTDALVAMLDDPPTTHLRHGRPADDLEGTANRDEMLGWLFPLPDVRPRLLDAARVLAWPPENRRTLGALAADARPPVDPDAVAPLLADDAFALGWAEKGLETGREAPFRFGAALVAGTLERPALRAAFADRDEFGPSTHLAPYEDEDGRPRAAPAIEPAIRAALRTVLATATDPYLVDGAARVLALEGGPEDVAALLANAARLDAGLGDHRSSVGYLAAQVGDPTRLGLLLGFVASPEAPPGAAVDVFRALVDDLLQDTANDPDEEARVAPFRAQLLDGADARLAALPGDRVEACLLALIDAATDAPAIRRRIDAVLDGALAATDVPGVRVRVADAR